MENYTFVGFLITCVLGLSVFVSWLVKKIIHITTEALKENSNAMKDLKFAIHENSKSIESNIEAVKDLRQTITTTLKHN